VYCIKCIILSFISIALFSLAAAQAQENDKGTELSSDAKIRDVEKIYYVNQPPDTINRTQNPTDALFKSLFFPGAGQFDNKSYIKGTIVFSAEVALIGAVVHYTEKASHARQAFESAKEARAGVLSERLTTIPYGSVSVSDAEFARLFNDYQDTRDEKNLFRWYLGAFIFLSMFDAFVDAHLAQFPKYDEKISFDIESNNEDMLTVKLSYNFW
jgi:hypothetical protein